MNNALIVGIFLALVAAPVMAQAPGNPGSKAAAPPGAKPLPELKGLVSWKTLAQVDLIKQKDRFVPQFSDSVASLDKKEVKIQGYMMPLEAGEKQNRFILASAPQTCMFCMSGGPEQFVEVLMSKPIKFTFEPVVIGGRMAVIANDPGGVYYRITGAVAH